MQLPPVVRNNLTTKLSLLVTAAVMLVLLLLGAYFDTFLRSVFLDSTSTRMQHAYQRLSYNLARTEQELKDGVAFFKTDERIIASVELINKYQDKAHYNTFLIDEEKKSLATLLLDHVKMSFNSDIVLYGESGELIAYASRGPHGYELGYLSYVAGLPVIMARLERAPSYQVGQLPANTIIQPQHTERLAAEQSDLTSLVSYARLGDRLAITGHQSLLDRSTGRLIAHLELSQVLDADYFAQMSKELDIQMRQSFRNDFGVQAEAMQSNMTAIPVFQVDAQYVSVLKRDVIDGVVYFAVLADKSSHNAVINTHRLRFLLMLLVVALFVLLLMRRVIQRGLALPLDKLMTQVRRIERGDYSTTPAVTTGDELQEISISVNHLATAVQERESSLEQARNDQEYLSNHDSLTGLSNRRFFTQRLEHALDLARRNQSKLAVLFLDLDQFKLVNDTLGHGVGDALLIQVAERLRRAARSTDTLARIGGDEFNVLLENVSDTLGVEVSVTKYLHMFRQPFQCGEHCINTTVSIGVALYPKDGADSTELLKSADLAVYKSKESGRDKFSFFSDDLSRRADLRAEMIHALHLAISAGDQFSLVYQPKVSALTGHMVSAEALLRWESPAFGNVAPLDFIPLAEETGQILAIGDWVIGQACRDLATMQAAGLVLDHVSLNVSNVQLRGQHIMETLLDAVRSNGLHTTQIELEITESYIANDTTQAIKALHDFRTAGFQLAIDDFGTGYSSMSYLQRLPFTRLKIDKSFVDGLPRDQDSVSITRAIVGLAKNFGLSITAEGVEREEQLQFLQQERCDEIQGYFFSKPLTLKDFLLYGHDAPLGALVLDTEASRRLPLH